MANNPDITKAIELLKNRSDKYTTASSYYDGAHNLSYATDKFINAFGKLFRAFALNLCPAIVDAVRDKLIVTEFRVEDGTKETAEKAWQIWQANRMGKRAGEIHKEALKNGDAYAIVWPDTQGRVTIYPQKAETCTVFYDEETPGKIVAAAKYWFTADKKVRLNLYYPDRVEKFVAEKKSEPTGRRSGVEYDKNFTGKATSYISLPEPKSFAPIGEAPVVANPYGVVPVFHFGNNAEIGSFGQSELANAIPLQDALNKSVLDMLVAMEFAAYRQRWAAGIEIDYDDAGKPIPPFQAGIERLWVTENPEAKFGDFEAADLEQFLKVKDGFRVDMSCVTGTPLHYFMLTGAAFPQSGISIEKLESRFLAKVRDRQETFGQVWEDVMAFALTIENAGKDIRLFTQWQNPAPLSEKEQLDNLIVKKELGVSDEQLLIEAGYGETDALKMLSANAAKADAAVKRFNEGDQNADPLQ